MRSQKSACFAPHGNGVAKSLFRAQFIFGRVFCSLCDCGSSQSNLRFWKGRIASIAPKIASKHYAVLIPCSSGVSRWCGVCKMRSLHPLSQSHCSCCRNNSCSHNRRVGHPCLFLYSSTYMSPHQVNRTPPRSLPQQNHQNIISTPPLHQASHNPP